MREQYPRVFGICPSLINLWRDTPLLSSVSRAGAGAGRGRQSLPMPFALCRRSWNSVLAHEKWTGSGRSRWRLQTSFGNVGARIRRVGGLAVELRGFAGG